MIGTNRSGRQELPFVSTVRTFAIACRAGGGHRDHVFHRPGVKRSSPDVVPECRVPRACAHHNRAAPVLFLENSPVDYRTTMLTHLRPVTRITLAIVV